jgi:putative transposase
LDRTRQTGGKKGTKRSLLVDARGIPLSLVVSGAQRHDVKLLDPTLTSVVVRRPKNVDQHLCADKGYVGKPAEKIMKKRHYIPHVPQRGEEMLAKERNPRHRAKRWVVERTHSWINRYRKVLVRYEKRADSYEGLLEIACALTVFRQSIVIYG